MWIIGSPDDQRVYQFSNGLEKAATIVLTDVNKSIKQLVSMTDAKVIERNDLALEDYARISEELTQGKGFDDIVILNPQSASGVSEISRHAARRGTINLVGQTPLDGDVQADAGRLHYDYIAFLGNRGPDIAGSYGEERNRCELKPGGSSVFIGAGGPMGQMHVQRALEMANGPQLLVITEINDERLSTLRTKFEPLAEEKGSQLYVINPLNLDTSLKVFVDGLTGGKGVDDVVVCVPSAALMAEAATLTNSNGLLVFFAGVPNGTLVPLDLSNVYLHNAQYTGTSGLSIDDQIQVLDQAEAGKLSPGRMVAAVGGMQTAYQAIEAVMDGRYPGKIVIYPQLPDLPLLGLDELAEKIPSVAAKLGSGNVWTVDAEAALFEKYWPR